MKIHWQVLKGQKEAAFIFLDLLLLVLISINLVWLLADVIVLNSGVGVLLARHFPGMVESYRHNWHEDLQVYDSFFTLFLISELLLRWGVAIWQKTYYRWFFYPFVHWYDVLGCIPLPTFRALRLLRLVSIAWRLQRLGVIDLSEAGFFAFVHKYYRIVIEELSDRIVVNVLEGIQREIRSGGPITHRLAEEVLKPRRDVIVPWLAGLLSETSAHAHGQHRDELSRYLDSKVRHAVAGNAELQKLKKRLLFAGPSLEQELQRLLSSLLASMLGEILTDISQRDNAAIQDVAAGLFDTLTTPDESLDDALRSILLDALELLKTQVSIQQWKEAQKEAQKHDAVD